MEIPPQVRTILLIEDSADDAKLVSKLLTDLSRNPDKIVHVEDLKQAKETLLSLKVDAILLDLRLPDGDGIQCVRAIREVDQNVPIVVLTGSDDEKLALECIAVGAQDYLTKTELRPLNLHRALGHAITRAHEAFQKRLANAELLVHDQQMRALAVRLNEVRESERKRISRTVHDELGQVLTGLKIDLSWLMKHLSQIPAADGNKFLARLLDAQKLADSALETVHRIAIELRPSVLDVLGLATAIREEAHRFGQRTGIKIHLEIGGTSSLDSKIATELFRILQELLTNVARHSRATSVRIFLEEKNKNWCLKVEDNGVGFHLEEKFGPTSLGLLGIRERAEILNGSVKFVASVGKGVSVVVTIPEEKQTKE